MTYNEIAITSEPKRLGRLVSGDRFDTWITFLLDGEPLHRMRLQEGVSLSFDCSGEIPDPDELLERLNDPEPDQLS